MESTSLPFVICFMKVHTGFMAASVGPGHAKEGCVARAKPPGLSYGGSFIPLHVRFMNLRGFRPCSRVRVN